MKHSGRRRPQGGTRVEPFPAVGFPNTHGLGNETIYGAEFTLNADETAEGMTLWATNASGQPTMKGTTTW